MTISNQALISAQNNVYIPCGFKFSEPIIEAQNAEYGACVFNLDAFTVRFRAAKVTPTKIGQFVTLWERSKEGPIQPFDASESIDFYVISTSNGNENGQFIFPKLVLFEHDILKGHGKGGKRAFRVYPPWDKAENRQAVKSQLWQSNYFLDMPLNSPIDLVRARLLYSFV